MIAFVASFHRISSTGDNLVVNDNIENIPGLEALVGPIRAQGDSDFLFEPGIQLDTGDNEPAPGTRVARRNEPTSSVCQIRTLWLKFSSNSRNGLCIY